MHRCVHRDNARVTLSKLGSSRLAAMRRTVVDNPKHATGGPIRLLPHNLVDQPPVGGFAGFLLAAAKDDGEMDIPGRQVLDGSTALLLVFDAHGLMRTRREGRLGATTH